jgi:hypothetical protein
MVVTREFLRAGRYANTGDAAMRSARAHLRLGRVRPGASSRIVWTMFAESCQAPMTGDGPYC